MCVYIYIYIHTHTYIYIYIVNRKFKLNNSLCHTKSFYNNNVNTFLNYVGHTIVSVYLCT